MTYLHDAITAADKVREVTPKLIAALMPTLDHLGLQYESIAEGDKGLRNTHLIVTGLELPEGYRLRIDFTPVKQERWISAQEAKDMLGDRKGPGF